MANEKVPTMLADRKIPNTSGWQDRHDSFVKNPTPNTMSGMIVEMLGGWAEYAHIHQQRYESPIGDGGVLGEQWEAIGDGLRGLLNGETGFLDCGTLDGFILDTMKFHGVDTEQK